jgi:Domain of unknown function (DUF4351)
MGQTIAEAIWEEGLLKGRSEGLSASRRLVRQLLAKRFGTVPDAIIQRIENTTDLDRLTAAALQVLDIAAPEDLQF